MKKAAASTARLATLSSHGFGSYVAKVHCPCPPFSVGTSSVTLSAVDTRSTYVQGAFGTGTPCAGRSSTPRQHCQIQVPRQRSMGGGGSLRPLLSDRRRASKTKMALSLSMARSSSCSANAGLVASSLPVMTSSRYPSSS